MKKKDRFRKRRSKYNKGKRLKRRQTKAKQKKKKSERVSTGVAVIAFDQDTRKIVIGLRNGSHGSNLWALPGGWLEKGESFEGCGLRELVEETGLSLKDNVESCVLLPTPPCLNKLQVMKPKCSSQRNTHLAQTTFQKTEEKVEQNQPSLSDTNSESSRGQNVEALNNTYETFYSVTTFVLVLLKRNMKHELEIKEKDKCVEWKWIDPTKRVEEIGENKLFPSLQHLLNLELDYTKLHESKGLRDIKDSLHELQS